MHSSRGRGECRRVTSLLALISIHFNPLTAASTLLKLLSSSLSIIFVGLLMKVTALFLFLSILVRPSTLLITIYSWHGLITASEFVATFYHGSTHISPTGLNLYALAVFPQRTHLAPAECLKAPFLGQSFSIFILHPLPLSLNRTTLVSNNTQTIHSFISLSPLKAFLKVCFLSKIVFLTFGPGSVITVSLSTQIKLTQFSLALAINSVLYLLSLMSMLQAPRYSYKKSENSWINIRSAAHFSGSCQHSIKSFLLSLALSPSRAASSYSRYS